MRASFSSTHESPLRRCHTMVDDMMQSFSREHRKLQIQNLFSEKTSIIYVVGFAAMEFLW